MAYLIDETYFNLNINVPNTTEVEGSLVQLNQFIDTKSRLLILTALGYDLFKHLDSFLTNGLLPAVPTLPTVDPVPLKWRNLCTGAEYTKNGKTVKWNGLYHTDGTTKQSLIAHYVFTEWLKNSVSQVNGIGEVSLVAKNATNVNSTQRYVEVWNDFVFMYQGNTNGQYLNFHYPNVYGFDDWFGCNENSVVSLIEFLIDNSVDYPGANTFRYETKNQLGL